MSIETWAADDLFIFRVVKFLATNPDNKWANSYEFRATGAGDAALLSTLASALLLFEQGLHRTSVQFSHILTSTWEQDSVPYNPFVFVSTPVVAAGTVPVTAEVISLDKCLSVARVPLTGRFGHLFFRGALTEEEVTAPAGKSTLANPAALQARVDASLAASELDAYIGSGAEAPLVLCMVSADGSTVRDINTLTVLGVAGVPTDHAWFNRTSTP